MGPPWTRQARGPVMRWGEWSLGNLERVLVDAPEPVLNTILYAGIVAQASAYGLLHIAVILIPVVLVTRVMRIKLFS